MLYLNDSDMKKLGIRNKSHREKLITSLINLKPTLIPGKSKFTISNHCYLCKLGIRNKSHRETLITSLINLKPTLIPGKSKLNIPE